MTAVEHPSTRLRSTALSESSLTQDLLTLRSTVADVLLTHSHRVAVDVSDLGRPSSTAVAALLWAKRSGARGGVAFEIHGARPSNRDVLRRCGLLGQGGGS
jgi:anti-anti-sigma regulatory factor